MQVLAVCDHIESQVMLMKSNTVGGRDRDGVREKGWDFQRTRCKCVKDDTRCFEF